MTPTWHRLHPIFGTDLSLPMTELVTKWRSQLIQMRGELSDFRAANPGWGDRTESIEGLLTCGLVCLYNVREEMVNAGLGKESEG